MMRKISLVLYTIFLFCVGAQGAEYHVPRDFPTIQSAIDNCKPNDSVILSPGKYTGDGNRDIVFNGKRVGIAKRLWDLFSF